MYIYTHNLIKRRFIDILVHSSVLFWQKALVLKKSPIIDKRALLLKKSPSIGTEPNHWKSAVSHSGSFTKALR